jgi:hypothetical protein
MRPGLPDIPGIFGELLPCTYIRGYSLGVYIRYWGGAGRDHNKHAINFSASASNSISEASATVRRLDHNILFIIRCQ